MTTDPTQDDTTPPQPFDEVRERLGTALYVLQGASPPYVKTYVGGVLVAWADVRSALARIADLERRLGEADELIYVAIHAGDKLNASIKRYEIEPRHEFEELVNVRDRMRSFRKDGSQK